MLMMSGAFGIAIESERWMASLPENIHSQSIRIPEVWDKLEQIAEIKGLTKLSYFIVEDSEIYQDALESLEEDAPEYGEIRNDLQQRIEDLAEQTKWFSPEDAGTAIKTMLGLIEYLKEKPNILDRWGKEASEIITSDLGNYIVFLRKVESRNIRFSFWMD
jgi:hypothetical protein